MRQLTVTCFSLALGACGSNSTTPAEDAANAKFPLMTNFPSRSDADATPVGGRYSLLNGRNDSLLTLQLFAANGSLGHDHVIRSSDFTGDVTFSWPDVSSCAVNVTLNVDGLKADEDDMRELVGLDGTLPASQQSSIKQAMTAKNQLDSASFSTMGFQGTRCTTTSDTGAAGHPIINVDGTLTIHGTPKAVTLPLEVATQGNNLAVRGRLTLSHGDFGMKPFNQFNLFKNKDELYLQVDVRGARQ